MISDVLYESVARIREYLNDPVFAGVYQKMRPRIEEVIGFMESVQAILDTTPELAEGDAMTLLDRARYIEDHSGDIPVRVLVSGRWTDEYLTALPSRLAIREAFRLLLRPEIPHRRISEVPTRTDA